MAGTKRISRERRRLQVAEAALRLVGTHGLADLTMAKLAADVGVTAGALFRHFESRDEILEAAVEDAVERLEATFPDDALPPLDRLFALARARIRLVRGDRGLAWLLLSEEAQLALPDRAVKTLRRFVKRSQRFLLACLREGDVRRDIAPETLLVTVVGTLHMLIRVPGAHRSFGARPQPERVLEALKTMIRKD